jgi:hypothetical protein
MRNLFLRFLLLVAMTLYSGTAGFCGLQPDISFVYAQLQYAGSWDPYPGTWRDILEFVAATTSIAAAGERRILTIDRPELFSTPCIFIVGSGDFPQFTAAQRERLRRYLSNGGLLIVDDASAVRGGRFDRSFRQEIVAIYPEARLRRLTAEHPVYRSYYLLRSAAGRRLNSTLLEGIDAGGRTVVLYAGNDLTGCWAKDRFGNYLWPCVPGGEQQRFEAQKLMQNLIMYSITGTYKSDAIHQPYLEQKMNR